MHDVIVTLLATVDDIILATCCFFYFNHYTIRHYGFSSVLFCFL